MIVSLGLLCVRITSLRNLVVDIMMIYIVCLISDDKKTGGVFAGCADPGDTCTDLRASRVSLSRDFTCDF